MVFLVVTYGSESWTIKKAECQRIDAFELWCWRRLLRVPLTARRSNQSILKEISPEYSLEGLMLKWKLQYFGYPMQGADSLVQLVRKDPNARKHWRQEKKGMTEDEIVGWHHWLNGYEFEQVPGVGEGQGSPACCNFMELQRVGHDGATELNWYSKLKKKYTIYNCRFQLLYGIFFSKFIDNRWWNWNVNNILHDDYKITETEWSFIIL